jgi:lactate 2-monooxygenase
VSSGRGRQAEVFLAGVRGRRPRVPADPAALEARARDVLSPQAFAYLAGGAGSEATMRANREAFERRRIVPRVLRDVSAIDAGVELFGRRLPAPVMLAPIGVLELARRDGDLLAARAAAAEGVPFVFSTQASVPMERCAAGMGGGPRWFQLYRGVSDELAASLVRRAEACGCEAIVLTLDTAQLGWRVRDLDLGYLPFLYGKGLAQYTSDPVFRRLLADVELPPAGRPTPAALRALAQLTRAHGRRARAVVKLFLDTFSKPLDWSDVEFVRGLTTLPLVLKGVLHPDDARVALLHGADAIIVSNHGGRQVDGAIATLDALPAVVDAVGGRVPVLLDSGIRGGADVFKALALGARAVLLGRPYAFALAVAGEAGVRETIRNLVADFDLTLGLAGCASAAELGPEWLE